MQAVAEAPAIAAGQALALVNPPDMWSEGDSDSQNVSAPHLVPCPDQDLDALKERWRSSNAQDDEHMMKSAAAWSEAMASVLAPSTRLCCSCHAHMRR